MDLKYIAVGVLAVSVFYWYRNKKLSDGVGPHKDMYSLMTLNAGTGPLVAQSSGVNTHLGGHKPHRAHDPHMRTDLIFGHDF